MTRIFLATIPSGADVFVDSRLAEADLAAFKAAELMIAEERQRQALEEAAPPTPTPETPTRTLVGLLGGRAGGFFA